MRSQDPRIRKALQTISLLRSLAVKCTGICDARQYLLGLLFNAIFRATINNNEKYRDRQIRALMLAGIFCHRLDHWNEFLAPCRMETHIAELGGIMLEIGPQHTLEYRQEVLSRVFQYVQSADLFYVIGAASMGKTRLLDFLMRADVQKHYLGERAHQHWLIRVDLNRMPVHDPGWSFYELLISSILLDLHNHATIDNLEADLAQNRCRHHPKPRSTPRPEAF